MRLFGTLAAAVLAAAMGTAGAEASTVRIGTLVCDVAGGTGFIVGSRKTLACDFRNAHGPDEFYDGAITKIGVDAGFTSGTRVVWAVLAPSTQVSPGALEGSYFGVSAEATPVIGVGANVLVGGFDSSINLQPVSVQGQVGLNVAAGVSGLRLRSAELDPAPVKR